MAARAPEAPAVNGTDDVLAAVLAALQRAPLVPLTDQEAELLAEVEGHSVRWIAHEPFVARLPTGDDRE